MQPTTLRTMVWGRRGIAVAMTAAVLVGLAVWLAIGVVAQAQQLARTTGAGAAATSAAADEPSSHHDHHGSISAPAPDPAGAFAPDPTFTPRTVPDEAPASPPETGPSWSLAASFGDADGLTGVLDIAAWRGTFVALGTSWAETTPVSYLWRSSDGRSWTQVPLALEPGALPTIVAPLADGRLVVMGTLGGSVEYWSEPARPAAWVSTDAVTWTRASLPFGDAPIAAPIEFAAGAEGLLATTGSAIWHSPDGAAWQRTYVAPRGTTVHAPAAGDEGWIVKRVNASHSTTTLLVSGDAAIWHEVAIGNVATVANVAGDWLASRHTDDWLRTEVLRSANGLDWTVILTLDELTPPEGSDGTLDASTLGGAMLSGTDEVLLMSPWQSGHCTGMPGGGWGAWWSADGTTWTPAGIGGEAVVTHTVAAGGTTVLAGYTADTREVAFWVEQP